MRLSARVLNDVQNVNSFVYATEANAGEGDPYDLYLQLVDLEQLPFQMNYNPPGLRYVPAAGATLVASVLNSDPSKQFSRPLGQPYAQDGSIWKLSFQSTDPLAATVSLVLRLTEGLVTRTINANAVLLIGGHSGTC